MEPDNQSAPPVVAVVIVHEPGEWFDETLECLASQDYPGLRFLFLLNGGDVDEHGDHGVEAQIQARLPEAFVRSISENIGFAACANEVLRLVEGDQGLFLFCHDDIAPEPDAIRLLVEELYRSNAGAVGPKLVSWDDPHILQAVGLGLDRFGEVDQVVEHGEVDQEQHDGVRDVFVLPSACLLVRADLFREVGGFDPSITFHGEDVELCWRIHHSGARVVVVPSAQVRHLGLLELRRPDLKHPITQARNRVRAVATLTGASRLPLRLVELVALTLTELVVGLFTGSFHQAMASLRALVGLVFRIPSTITRRRQIAAQRHVPEREVLGLQVRGSARLNAFLRSRQNSMYLSSGRGVRRWRESTTAPVVTWIIVLATLLFASRTFIRDGVPSVGEFLPFPTSPRLLLESYVSAWNPTGAGATSANPTGWATLAGFSPITLFRMGMLQTVVVIGAVVIGLIGLARLVALFPSTRARIAALLVYAASPLVAGSMATGQLTVLVAYASMPWIFFTLSRAVGIGTADPQAAESDLTDALDAMTGGDRLRRLLWAVLVAAIATAFAPIMLVVTVAVGVVLAIGTLVALAKLRVAGWFMIAGAVAGAGAALLNLPWVTTWTWSGLVGAPPIGDPHSGLLRIASFDIGSTNFAVLAVVLYLPVVAALLLARAWRLTWAVRSGVVVVVFGGAAVLGDQGSLPFQAPQAGVLLAPVAVAVAMSAGAALAAFDLDVRGSSFGWRQPLGILAGVAIAVGVLPGVVTAGPGNWDAPNTTFSQLLDAFLPGETAAGDYNVLFVGDARLIPVPATEYRDGTSWAITDDRQLDVRDRWMPPPNSAATMVTSALDRTANSSTLRAGQLLAPLGIRYIVVPKFDGVVSTTEDPLALPIGLVDALEDQLDISAITSLPTLLVFENQAWISSQAILGGPTAEASRSAGEEALVRADLSDWSPAFVGADQLTTSVADLSAGVVNLAVPFDEHWTLTVDGTTAPARRSFGEVTGFDVAVPGTGDLRYASPQSRTVMLIVQVALWLVVLIVLLKIDFRFNRQRIRPVDDETLIDLGTRDIGPDQPAGPVPS